MSLFTELKACVLLSGLLHSEKLFHWPQKERERERRGESGVGWGAADKLSHPWWLKPDDIHLQTGLDTTHKRGGVCLGGGCKQIAFLSPIKTFFFYRIKVMSRATRVMQLQLFDFPKQDLCWKTEGGLVGGEGGTLVARDSAITRFEWRDTRAFEKTRKHESSRGMSDLHSHFPAPLQRLWELPRGFCVSCCFCRQRLKLVCWNMSRFHCIMMFLTFFPSNRSRGPCLNRIKSFVTQRISVFIGALSVLAPPLNHSVAVLPWWHECTGKEKLARR